MRFALHSLSILSSKNPLLLANLLHSAIHVSKRNPSPMDGAEASLRESLTEKQTAVDDQAGAVRDLKARGVTGADLDAAVDHLKALKLEAAAIGQRLQVAISSNGGGGEGSVSREAFRQAVVNTLERRLFYIPSFKIYRGVAGLYDYGPPGCAVKSNVLAFWRQVRGEVL